MRHAGRYRLLTPKELDDLGQRSLAGDLEARDTIVRHNLRLVPYFARRYTRSGVPFDDLIGTACQGLIRAAELFDPDHGVPFASYAKDWIISFLQRAVAFERTRGRFSTTGYGQLRRILVARDRLALELGRPPSPAEIAVVIEMSESRVADLLEIYLNESSMDAPIGDDASLSLGEVLPCPTDIEEEVLTEGSQAELNRLLDEILTDRENIIVRLYFGLCGAPEHALSDIGYYLDISRERVRQLLQRALAKLRAHLSPEMFGFALAVSPEDQP